MAIYSLRRNPVLVTNAAANEEVRTAATDRAAIMEIDIFLGAATASRYGIGRPAAIGVTPTSPITVIAEDPAAPAGTVTTALAWGTAPTVPAQFFRAIALPATIGTGVIWTFPRGLLIAISSSMVFWNLATNAADVENSIVVDE
jgi:hypothetical protein